MLREAGFDEQTAGRLAGRHPLDVIQRQLHWLEKRNVTRNRLGFLLRAIEQDWPAPEGIDNSESAVGHVEQGKVFASHYYAAYHGFSGVAATEPFPKDIELAAQFVLRLLSLDNNPELIPQWGRRFGRMMRDRHQGEARAKPNLSPHLCRLVTGSCKLCKARPPRGSAHRWGEPGKCIRPRSCPRISTTCATPK